MKRYEGFKVLIVDDNPHNLYSLRTLIQRHMDVEVREAASGREALEIAMAETDLDLVILDVQMPEMDGFEVASLLKMRKRTRDIPVIFLTAAFKADEFQRRGYDMGAVDYLLKPIDDHLLLNKISAYFRLIEKERELNRRLEEEVRERTRELEYARRYQEQLIDAMGEALLVLDPDGRIKFANPAAYRLLGYAPGELERKAVGDVFEEADQEQAGAFMGTWLEALIRTGLVRDIEARFIARDGRRVPVLFSRTALTGDDGKVTDIICVAKDMTGYQRICPDAAGEEPAAATAGDRHE